MSTTATAAAPTTTPDLVAVRALVTYHGSLTGHRGSATVVAYCECEDCWDAIDYAHRAGAPRPEPRYELIPVQGSGMLLHVRRVSFTVVAA